MFAGVGIIGSLASILASILVPPPKQPEEPPQETAAPAHDSDIVATELASIRTELAALRQSLVQGSDPR